MRLFLCCLALVLLPQCGGGTATSEGPKSAGDDRKSSADSSDAASESGERGKHDSDEEEPSSGDAATSQKSQGPSCDDGTCSKCGNGICPTGWYCDEKASGGGACSWLTECAEKPTCGCVTRVLGASCKCREESGGLKVACD
jgi:hypothetical protein